MWYHLEQHIQQYRQLPRTNSCDVFAPNARQKNHLDASALHPTSRTSLPRELITSLIRLQQATMKYWLLSYLFQLTPPRPPLTPPNSPCSTRPSVPFVTARDHHRRPVLRGEVVIQGPHRGHGEGSARPGHPAKLVVVVEGLPWANGGSLVRGAARCEVRREPEGEPVNLAVAEFVEISRHGMMNG